MCLHGDVIKIIDNHQQAVWPDCRTHGAPETTKLVNVVLTGLLDHAKNEDKNFSQTHKFGNQSVVNGSIEMQDQGDGRNTHNVIIICQ